MSPLLKYLFGSKSEFENKIKKVIGYFPNDLFLFEQAMVHKSLVHDATYDNTESNERLELLGDAVLGMIIAEYLYLKFPNKDEGELTKLRSLLVSRRSLNEIALKIGLQDILLSNLNDPLESKNIYGNAFEALVGAIYLDAGLKRSKKFILKRILGNVVHLDEVLKLDPNFKTKVIEWAQAAKLDFNFVTTTQGKAGRDVIFESKLMIDDQEVAKASAKSKKTAEQKAAEQYYNSLNRED